MDSTLLANQIAFWLLNKKEKKMEKLEISKLQDEKSVVIAYIESKGYKNKYFWKDPSYSEGPEHHASGLCDVVNWQKECLVFRCFSKLAYEDYEHCQDDGKFGLEIGDFDYEGTCIESFENTWFETELDRNEYIKRNGSYLDSAKIPE